MPEQYLKVVSIYGATINVNCDNEEISIVHDDNSKESLHKSTRIAAHF